MKGHGNYPGHARKITEYVLSQIFFLSCCKYGRNLVNQIEINMKIKKEKAKEDVMCTFVLDFPRLGEKMPTLSSQNS